MEVVSPADWYCGGRSLAETGHSSFFVDIKIVETTNDKGEKATFIREVFARLGELLGNPHPESYIYVHEVRADAYGFGGLTQERRYVARELGLKP